MLLNAQAPESTQRMFLPYKVAFVNANNFKK